MKGPLYLLPVWITLMAVFSGLLTSGSSQGPQSALAAPARQGGIEFGKVDADPGNAGIQSCRSVAAGETFSIDVLATGVNAADSVSFAEAGNVGIFFSGADATAAFTFDPSNAVDFGPGVMDDVASGVLIEGPQGSTTTHLPGFTHISKGYANAPPITDASMVVGDIILARITLTPAAAADSSLQTIGITKTSPRNSNWDTLLSAVLTPPTMTQPAIIAVGLACPQDGSPPDTGSGGQDSSGGQDVPQTDSPSTTTEGAEAGPDSETDASSGSQEEADAAGGEETVAGRTQDADAGGPEEAQGSTASVEPGDDGANWALIVVVIVGGSIAAVIVGGGAAWWRLRRTSGQGGGG